MRTRHAAVGILALTLAALPGTSRAQDLGERRLDLAFDDAGRVTLVAQNVTTREILAEWGRQCGCHVVNDEQLAGGTLPLPVRFESATQQVVLESLLRDAAGFVLTPRRAGTGPSNYETIYILATSNPVAGGYIPPPMPMAPPPPTAGSPDDELPPVVPMGPMPAPADEVPATPAASNPFPSRTSTPNVFAPNSFTPAQPQSPSATPGTTTPPPAPPQVPRPYPGGVAPPPRSGTAVPIVPVPADQ